MTRAGLRHLQAWARARSAGTFTVPKRRMRDHAQERKNKRAGFKKRWRAHRARHEGSNSYLRRMARHLYFHGVQ